MIEIAIDIGEPRVNLLLTAEPDSVPVVRQALRSFGDSLLGEREALEDMELAVTEACENVVEHAYPTGTGVLDVTLEPAASTGLLVTVSDRGGGMPPRAVSHGGFGLAMIEGIAGRVDIAPRAGGGTEVVMYLDIGARSSRVNGNAPAAAPPLARIARRIVAVISAQGDMASDRLVESLLAVELATRHAPTHLQGERVQLTLERLMSGGFDMRIGPLVADGASAVVSDSELPVIGPVIERLADQVEFELGETTSERLRLRVGSG